MIDCQEVSAMNELEKRNEATMLFPAQKEERREAVYRRTPSPKVPKSYIFYCCMTLSVMLLTIAFAATELFSVFFSDVYPDRIILSKLFGSDAESGMSIEELMLNQSFGDLSFKKDNEDPKPPVSTGAPVTTEKPESTETPEQTDKTTEVPVTTEKPTPTEPPSVTEKPVDIYAPNNGEIPAGMSAILPMDLSLFEYGIDYIYNTSSKSPDMNTLGAYNFSTDLSSVYPAGAPLVLIVHTHGTEGYSDEGSYYYDPNSEIARTTDKNRNVVHIGKIISDILNASGIPTLHSDIMHDEESYSGSYERSAATIKEYLARYPSIRYVIDVHRDAVIRSDGELVRPVALTENGSTAQIMAVIGTGESIGGCPNYMNNLSFAQSLREELSTYSKMLSRPTCLRPSAYNQQYSVYSLLLEIGAAGNTLSEAERAAELVGEALSRIIVE